MKARGSEVGMDCAYPGVGGLLEMRTGVEG